jgi:hypothetical protein
VISVLPLRSSPAAPDSLAPARSPSSGGGSDERRDLVIVALAVGFVVIAVIIGWLMNLVGVPLHAPTAPLYARFHPHLGPGTPLALVMAALVISFGPQIATGWRWPLAVSAATGAGLAWTTSLALVGGRQGILGPLASPYEYLVDVPRVGSLPEYLRTFAAGIPANSPMPWHTHTAGHPPGLLLVFVLLARAGLPGPGPASIVCLLAWTLVIPIVAGAARAACGEDWARRALPFSVLLPAVIWAGVSADAIIAATGALGLLLLTRAATGQPAASTPATSALAAAGGLVLAVTCFLSYGAVLLAVPALAVLMMFRRWRLVLPTVIGAAIVVVAFALAGFAWWDGFSAVHARYLAGYGGSRPGAYWSWADLAALAIAAGPAVVAGLARLIPRQRLALTGPPIGALALAGGALAAMLLATASGMSKAEVERIWLPWIVWLPMVCAALPWHRVRWWLAGQALVALLVEHLLITPW